MITHKGNSSRLLLLFGLLASTISPTQAVGILLPRSSDTCPSDYTQCSSSGLPSTFCCPSSSTCISLDDGSSAICCPAGQSCDYIEPITCDVQLQNATSHPKNSVHTTRLDDSLAKCGSKCCPFGYTCTGDSLCSMDTSTASTAAASSATSSTTSSTTSSSSSSSLATAISATDPRVSTSSAADNTNTNTTSSATATQLKCPQYPTAAVLAGFFPGALLGVTATLLSLLLYRHHRRKNLPPSAKIAQFTHRSSKGTLIGISSPMPSEETAYRTDFLLRRTQSRASKATTTGSRSRSRSRSRSMIQKTGGRVRSLFNPHNPVYQREGTTARGVGGGAGVETALVPERGGGSRVPVPVPPLPLNINGNLVVKQTQQDGKGGVATYSSPPVIPALPRTESIRVYTPPGVFATTGVLKPDAYPTNPRAMEAFSEDPEGSGGGGGGLSRGSSRLGSQRR
ncbi:uncharacterized protein BO72DRAFT_453400 [Aspergillus fijiensis CBS 313.89]|uniref:GPI transamidase component PIG-S n=1 Tax=Aspergillus fijiensis CBS 313.89 TaxID=1448319 RepID=A0A8G1RHX0_9EURO|nr:uncharacterized protein BO72DRAFT_453400 [Aspergillus fijiensis CBS 313.89]RAK71786.1 hypothetical protein BO72DRAFT_453400 [Aspergillus fijiensis CBS 313.89]